MPGPLDWHIVRFVYNPLALIADKPARDFAPRIKINETEFCAKRIRREKAEAGWWLLDRIETERKRGVGKCFSDEQID